MLNQIQQATVTFSSDGKEKVSFGANCHSIRFDKSGTENTLGQIKLRVCNANNFVTNYITPKEGMQINGIDFDACEVEGTGACGVILTVSTGSFSGGGGAGAALPKDATFDSVVAMQYMTVGDDLAKYVNVSPDGMQTGGGLDGNGTYGNDGIHLTRNVDNVTNRITAEKMEIKGYYGNSATLTHSNMIIGSVNNNTLIAGGSIQIKSHYGIIVINDSIVNVSDGNIMSALMPKGITIAEKMGNVKYSILDDYFDLDGFTIFNTSSSSGFSLTSKNFAGKFIGFRQTATSNTFQLNDKTFEMRVDTTTTPNRLVFELV